MSQTKRATRQIVLARMGAAPLRFAGTLLVTAQCEGSPGPDSPHVPVCTISVYEARAGFVGHITLDADAQGQPMRFAKQALDPLDVRRWIAAFDPAIAVMTSDVVVPIERVRAQDAHALSQAASTLTSRLQQLRAAYTQAREAVLGNTLEATQAA